MNNIIKAGKVDTRTILVNDCPKCLASQVRLRVDSERSNEEKTKTSFQVFCFECKESGYIIGEYVKPVKRTRKLKDA